ncbi:MAG: DDE-type integrase/transposase/recombinase [Rhodocyclales bacterium]|nr:DDE-type integrase/transposase/recombinase [Rhodocyclales bacterium]
MDDEKDDTRSQAIALFRYGLIADVVNWPPGQRGLYAKIREKTSHSVHIPYSRRTRVAEETMRGWLAAWRRGGFDALRPAPRSDLGRSRSIPPPVADLLCNIKDENHALSVALVIERAQSSGTVPTDLVLPNSTVHRLLSRAGLMEKRPDEPTGNDRRRFSFEKAGEMWMADVMHGPQVTVEDRRRQKSYLIAIIDDATRVVPFCAFALSENVAAFLPVFGQAVRRRGIPTRLYCDNGAAFRSHQLELACARLGIVLIHSRPYIPQGRGKIERWFRTVRLQFLPRLAPADTNNLEALNRALWGWVEGEYHQTPHHGLDGETPFDRWAMNTDALRLPAPDLDLDSIFLLEEKRKVARDRTVSLRGVIYEVDATLVGETVKLRFDPAKLGQPIEVWHKNRKLGTAKRVDLYANCFVKRHHSTKEMLPQGAPDAPPQGLKLRDLAKNNNPDEGDR